MKKMIYMATIATMFIVCGCSHSQLEVEVELIDHNGIENTVESEQRNAGLASALIYHLHIGKAAVAYANSIYPSADSGKIVDEIDKQITKISQTRQLEELVLASGTVLGLLESVKAVLHSAGVNLPPHDMKLQRIYAYVAQCNAGKKLAKNITDPGASTDTKFGGYLQRSMYVLEPSSKEYAEVLKNGRVNNEKDPISSVKLDANSAKSLMLVEESPGQWRVHHISTDNTQLAATLNAITVKTLNAALKYSGVPVELPSGENPPPDSNPPSGENPPPDSNPPSEDKNAVLESLMLAE